MWESKHGKDQIKGCVSLDTSQPSQRRSPWHPPTAGLSAHGNGPFLWIQGAGTQNSLLEPTTGTFWVWNPEKHQPAPLPGHWGTLWPSRRKKGLDTSTESSPAATWALVLITGSKPAAACRCCSFSHQGDALCARLDMSPKPSWLYCPSSSTFALFLLVLWSWFLLTLEYSLSSFPAPSLLPGSQHTHCAPCRHKVTA